MPIIIILSFAFGINSHLDSKTLKSQEKTVQNTETLRTQTNRENKQKIKDEDESVETKISNNIRVREIYGRIELLYRDINYTFGDNNFPAKGIKVNSIIKDEWTETQAYLENNEETKSYIWTITKSPDSNTFYFSVLHEQNTDYWSSLYQLNLENLNSIEEAVLITLVDTSFFEDRRYKGMSVPHISSLSPIDIFIDLYFSCVECEPGLYPDHYIMSVEGQNKFGYKNIGPVKDLTWNENGSFSYKRIPQECIDMVVSYETMEDSRKCVENTPAEIVVDSL